MLTWSSATRQDKASYRYRGGWAKIMTAYKAWRYLSRAGTGLVIKGTAEFRLTQGAVLEVGDFTTIQDFAFFSLRSLIQRFISEVTPLLDDEMSSLQKTLFILVTMS